VAHNPGSSPNLGPRSAHSPREGFALAAALLAVVLIGGLIAGVLFATTEETRTAAAGMAHEVALNACESALVMTITDSGVALPDSIGVAGTISRQVDGFGPPVIIYITRLDSTRYSIVAEVREPASAGRSHRVGIVVRASIAGDNSTVTAPISERPWQELF
jgi:hypothetical protein